MQLRRQVATRDKGVKAGLARAARKGIREGDRGANRSRLMDAGDDGGSDLATGWMKTMKGVTKRSSFREKDGRAASYLRFKVTHSFFHFSECFGTFGVLDSKMKVQYACWDTRPFGTFGLGHACCSVGIDTTFS